MHPFFDNLDESLRNLDRKRPWLAQASDISISTINTWYAENRLPKLDQAMKVANALGVSLDYLMTGEEPLERIEDPIIKNILSFLKAQDRDSLLRIEGALMLFNYMTLEPRFKRGGRQKAANG